MYSQYQAAGYNITEDPRFQNKEFGIDEALLLVLNKLFMECQQKNNKKIIPRLKELIVKYPTNPQLKNFLSVAYMSNGDYAKSTETTNQIRALHPDYLFGKLNLAYKFISDGRTEKIPEILGEAMELKALYPDGDLFHLTEVAGFYKAAVCYYAAMGNIEAAEKKLTILQTCAPGHYDTEAAEELMFVERMKIKFNKWTEAKKAKISVKCLMPVPASQQQTPPDFYHTEINNLYQQGIGIPEDKLHSILALPRETVIADLEKILRDAVDRYQYFTGLVYHEDEQAFPLHALFLLGELKAENSLPVILNFLENDKEVIDFWLGEHLTSTVWLPVYLLSQNNLGLLKSS